MELLGRGYAWFDTGTHQSLQHASTFIETVESRQGLKVACPEEIAYRNGYIDAGQLERLAAGLGKSAYGEYLRELLTDRSLLHVSEFAAPDAGPAGATAVRP
jgi:glucose-1-phosphate thymidylyltransferase